MQVRRPMPPAGDPIQGQESVKFRSVGHRRRGVTLIELMVVVTMFSMMASLTGMTIYFLMRSEKMVMQSSMTERTVSRLARQFRDDVHQAASGELTRVQSGDQLELKLNQPMHRLIRYRVNKEGIVRFVVEGDQAVAREDYRLLDCQVRLAEGSDNNTLMRSLLIDRPGATITRNPQAPRPRRTLEIRAYLQRREPNLPRTSVAVVSQEPKPTSAGREEPQ